MHPQVPNYHRQRFLLALLRNSGGSLSKIDLQKLLFLAQDYTNTEYYDFVPYHFGCYSFQAQSDIELFESRGWIKTVGHEILILDRCPEELLSRDESKLENFSQQFKNYRGKKLIRYVYEKYPYYAINSKMAANLLDTKTLEIVDMHGKQLKSRAKRLFTIGYEGISLEKYINQLITNDVRLLCDIRVNPFSRKFGFSKGTLSNVLPKLGIEYVHIPELGISSERRSGLETKSDYTRLFKVYKSDLLKKSDILNSVSDLFDSKKRIALTCFEKHPESCHRHIVSEHFETSRSLQTLHL